MQQNLSDLEAENAFKLQVHFPKFVQTLLQIHRKFSKFHVLTFYQAGLRELQTLGPTMKRTISGDLEQPRGNDITPLHRVYNKNKFQKTISKF
jgi:hypothetical protein